MNLDDGKHGPEQAAEEAASYLLDIQSGEQSAEERAAFVDWLRGSPLHVSELLRTARFHRRLERFGRWQDVKPLKPAEGTTRLIKPTSPRRRPLRQLSRQHTLRTVLAACVVVLTLLAVLLSSSMRRPRITTTTNQWRMIPLMDGSVVDLAPDSAIRPVFHRDRRLVYLERGEALFRVQNDPRRPFLVIARNTVVRDVGTTFDVNRRQADEIAVTVVEGVVQLTASPSTNAKKVISAAAAPADLSLRANEEVLISAVTGAAAPIQRVDTKTEVAWATGELDFDNEPVAFVISSFNRFNRVQIDVEDPLIASRRVNGSFRTNDPGSFVEFLATSPDVKVVRDGPEHIIIEGKRDSR